MNIEMFLSIASFALALGGLVWILISNEPKKMVILLTVIFSALFLTIGVVSFRGYQHEKLIINEQAKIQKSLTEEKTLDQLLQDLPINREYSVVTEALFREVDKGTVGQRTINFIRYGKRVPVRIYFIQDQ